MWVIKTRWFLTYFLITFLIIYLLLFLVDPHINFKARFSPIKNVGKMTTTAAYDVIPCLGDRKSDLRKLILNHTVYRLAQSWRAARRRCTHLMTIKKNAGRTGNRLFQVATLLGTALKHGYLPVLPTTLPLTKWFDLPFLFDEKLSNGNVYRDRHCAIYDNGVERLDRRYNWTLTGYFQSWRYFSHVQDVVRSAFRIKKQYLEKAKHFLSNVTIKGVQNVGVHVRRGDMLTNRGYYVADIGFIKRAMQFYKIKFDRVQFIIVSDGMPWCFAHIKGGDILYSPFILPILDLSLLSLCDHVIVTSGTFGWWGAWLANGITVYYQGYTRKGSQLHKITNMSDYYPPSWVGM